MKNLLLASTLLAGAAAPWTLRSQDAAVTQFPGVPQVPSREAELAESFRAFTRGGGQGESTSRQASTGGDSNAERTFFTQERISSQDLYRQLFEVERAMLQMEREHEIDAMQRELDLRLAAREAERRASLELAHLERAAEQLESRHEREILLAEQQFERTQWSMQAEQERAEERLEMDLEALELQLERSSELLQHKMETGQLEQQEGLAELSALEAQLAARESEISSERLAREEALQLQALERSAELELERVQQELTMGEQQAAMQAKIDELLWEMEDSADRLEVEREIDSLRRMVEHEARAHELEMRRIQIEQQIEQAESNLNGPSGAPLASFPQPEWSEVLERLERVEDQVDRLWATIEKLHSEKRESNLGGQNASPFRAAH